jgi:aspartate carbamoyltransferase regulatory subunit
MKGVRINPIRNGTVIDHIKPGTALKVLELLKIDVSENKEISVAMWAHSKKLGYKDIIKVEDMELKPKQVNLLAILTPNASISIIRDYQVVKKYKVELPSEIEGIVKCENLNCITNQKEPVPSRLRKLKDEPLTFRCFYCGRDQEDMTGNII